MNKVILCLNGRRKEIERMLPDYTIVLARPYTDLFRAIGRHQPSIIVFISPSSDFGLQSLIQLRDHRRNHQALGMNGCSIPPICYLEKLSADINPVERARRVKQLRSAYLRTGLVQQGTIYPTSKIEWDLLAGALNRLIDPEA